MSPRGLVAATSALLLAFPARAQDAPRAPAGVTAEGCAVDGAELARLVRLELASVIDASSDPSQYAVRITCNGGSARITLADPLTAKTLERIVVAPSVTDEEPERLLALTVAQLYRASWLELTTKRKDPPPLPPASAPPPDDAAMERARIAVLERTTPAPIPVTPPARPAIEPAATPEPPPTPPRPQGPHDVSVAVQGGFAARALPTETILGTLTLSVAWMPIGEWFWIDVGVGMEATSARRVSGTLEALLVKAQGGVAFEPLRDGPWSGFGELHAGIGVANIESTDLQPGYVGGSVLGPGFQGSLGFGVAAHIEPLRFELIGHGGFLVGTPSGLVADDEPLGLDGASAGVDLRVRWLL